LPRKERGFTLLEVLLAVVLIGLMMPAIGAALVMFLTVPARESDELNAIHQVRVAADWITLDGMRAKEFEAGSDPVYGTFSWEDRTGEIIYYHEVEYRWEDGKLIRQDSVKRWENNDWIYDSESEIAIARNIGNYSDVEFVPYAGDAPHLEVSINAAVGTQSKELTIYIRSRLLYAEEQE